MKIDVLSKKSSEELQSFFKKEFEYILIRILTQLNIQINFPIELEELIFSIPENQTFYDECQNAYTYIHSGNNIKLHIGDLIKIYENLLIIEKRLSCKR